MRMERGHGRRYLIAVVAVFGLLLSHGAVAAASPARYTYEICDSALPGGSLGGARNSLTPNEPWSDTQNCAAPGGSFGIGLGGALPEHGGGWASWGLPIEPPPGGKLESATVTASLCESAGTTGEVIEAGWPGPYCIPETRTFPLAANFRGFSMSLSCPYSCEGGAQIHAQYFATVMVDPVAPTIGEVGGTLLAGGTRRGHQSVTAKAADVGGGLSSVSVLVNGVAAATTPETCAAVHTQNASVAGVVAEAIVPCPPSASVAWTLDTGAYPFREGANTVSVCASDFATLGDPNTTCSTAQSVTVDDSCTESPVPGGEQLSADFSADHGETTTQAYGQGAEVSGTLTTNSGVPVSGATLCVKAATIGVEPAPVPVATVQTDAAGAYTYLLPPGPNRAIQIGYRHDAAQILREVRFYAHARPTLTASPDKLRNGHWVHFTGALPGPNRHGRVVVLQANVKGSRRWITFRKATSGKGGVFAAAYHFTQTARRTVYRFRAIVPQQAGYPWAEGHSEAVEVTVKPARRRDGKDDHHGNRRGGKR
jgi:hypothetical protein